jgi:pyridoxal phosphate enzyme (YggS family)
MDSIETNLNKLRDELPEGVKLVAVSKFHPTSALVEAYNSGQRLFGESRPQELKQKVDDFLGMGVFYRAMSLSDNAWIQWHFIGHLQTNKVKLVVPYCALIESVDSEHLLRAIDQEAERLGIVSNVLLEVHIAHDEETKQGFSDSELIEFIDSILYSTESPCSSAGSNDAPFLHIRLRGLMGMASNIKDMAAVKGEFDDLRSLFNLVRERLKTADSPLYPYGLFDTLSMGMTNDYQAAIEAGSTEIRVGTAIFGPRQY